MIQNIIVCPTATDSDNRSKTMAELRAKMPVCPICGKRAFLSHDVVDGANYGYASGCPAFRLNDAVHGISRPDDPKKPRFNYCDTKEEAYEKWVEYCKRMEEKMDNTDDFYKLVESMRTAQKRYFKTRDANYLEESRKLEKAVDKALAEHEELKRGGRLF